MDHDLMRRAAEFRQVFDGATDAGHPELALHRQTLPTEESREAAEVAVGRFMKRSPPPGTTVAMHALGLGDQDPGSPSRADPRLGHLGRRKGSGR